MSYTDVDYVAYPLKGSIFETGINAGASTGHERLAALCKTHQELAAGQEDLVSASRIPIPSSCRSASPFITAAGRLRGHVHQGLDRYVIDGVAGVVLRNTLFRELFNFNIPS